jgi:hypothetical protein
MKLLITLTLSTIWVASIGQTFDTEFKYTDSIKNRIIVQNSFPKGGQVYTDPTGKDLRYVVFWTRITNETTSPLELTINFSSDSLLIPSDPDNYFKLFIPLDTMTLDKDPLFNYGLTGLKSFLDTSFNKPTMLQRTLNPKEACLFYVIDLHHRGVNGVVRAGLSLKDNNLFYRVNDKQIPCGQLVFKKL